VDLNRDEPNGFEIHSKRDQSSRKAIFQLCVQHKWYLTGMTIQQTKLEDVFRELTMN